MSRFKDFDETKPVAYSNTNGELQVRSMSWYDINTFADLQLRNKEHLFPWEIAYRSKSGTSVSEYGIWLGDVPIGKITLWNIDKLENSCKLSYWVDQDYCNKGYMTKALDYVISYASSNLGIKSYLAPVQDSNNSSIRVLEKLQFNRLGPAVYETLDGTLINHYIYSRNTDANL
jgi:RimJ/RimL family protein N-acetyltransferase